MAILATQEREFLDVFFYEATNSPFRGPATKALQGMGVWYHDVSWLGWAYHREVGMNNNYTWGHPAEVAPPLPWPDRDAVLRRNQEIEMLSKQCQPA